jgi:GT2 family glycosyltransferase
MGVALHILLPVHNRCATTVRFVKALGRQTRQDFRLVLIDDGSTDGTAQAVRALLGNVDVLSGDGTWWWSGSLDQGCRHVAKSGVSDEDVLLLINDDVDIEPAFLEQALQELQSLHETLLLARQIDASSGTEIDFGGGVHADLAHLRFTPARHPADINCLPTRGLFMRWRDMTRTGGFRPEILPHYLSDYEFTLRARRAGLSLRIAQTATVRIRTEQTGRSLANLYFERRAQRFRMLFSPRFKDNPITWSRFVGLAAAPARRPFLWLKIWLHFLVVAVRCGYMPVCRDGSR